MLRRLSELGALWQRVCDGFGIEGANRLALKKVAVAALEREVRTHLMYFGPEKRVLAKDISNLDPGSEDDDVSGWGGLSGFSSRFGDAVRKAVNEKTAR